MVESAISSALASLRAASDLAQAMVSMSDIAVIKSKLSDLEFKLARSKDDVFSAQDERIVLLEQIRRLEMELADLKAREIKKQQLKAEEVLRG
jgi:hypothetical protein